MGLTTTRYIRWDDPGALKLDGTPGSFYAIIKAYLVAAGWSIEFDDPGNFKIALRNSMAHGGSGGYLRVHDDGSFTGGGRVASWRVYESMTDIDTGTGQCCDDWVWKAREAGGAAGADAVRRCYVISCDQRTVYVSTWVGDDNANPRGINPTPPDVTMLNTAYLVAMAVGGDYDAFIAGDPGVWGAGMTTQNPNNTTSTSVPSWLGAQLRYDLAISASNTVKLSRKNDLSSTPTQAALLTPWRTNNGYGIGTNNTPPMGAGDPFTTVPALIHDGTTLRGRARGLFAPLNDMVTNGGAPLGALKSPYLDGAGLQLVALAGAIVGNTNGTIRLFAETSKSWDDI